MSRNRHHIRGKLQKGEFAWIHTYARLAGLTRLEYEDLLHSACGVRTSKNLDHDTFDLAMAAIEAILWDRVAAGAVPDPRLHEEFKHLQPLHWRNKCPGEGMINSRLRYKIERLWALLKDYLPPEHRDEIYLARIIAHTMGYSADRFLSPDHFILWEIVPANAARLAIEAIKDRLKFAIRDRRKERAA